MGRRTIFRDLRTFRENGFPLKYDPKTERYYAAKSWRTPPTKLTSDEALALIALATEFGRYRQLPFFDSAYNAAVKLEQQLPKHLRRGLQRKLQAIKIRPSQKGYLSGSATIYQQLVAAIETRRVVFIQYESLTEWETIATKLRPYQLLYCKHSWYVLGHSSLHGEVRTFNLARIESFKMLPENTPPRGVSNWIATSAMRGT